MKPILLSITYFGILLLVFSMQVCAQSLDSLTVKDLTELSFDDLMRVEVKSVTLTGVQMIKTPGTITTISKEEIESTPYRNLLDLLEVYVPSMTFVNHWNGPRIGIRGIIGDQNNAFLLLVDGENMNMQSENGPLFEIQNKDLSDIEKIEIISGPGSVVYGPGAIGGVISITTKNAETAGKAHLGAKQNFTYNYHAVNGNYTLRKKKFSAYIFGSFGRSQGISDPKFYYIDRANGYGYGFMSSTWGNKGLGTPAPNFYTDFDNRPEMKIQLAIDFLKEFSFFARYTSFSYVKQQQETGSEEGPAFPGLYGQQFTTSLKNIHNFSNLTRLESNVGFQSKSYGEIQLYQGVNKPFDDITQRNNSFSENKLNAKTLLSVKASSKIEIALGAEFNYWYYGPEWGKNKSSFVMNFAPPVRFAVYDTTSSGFYQQYNEYGLVTFFDKRIDAYQTSGFFEINYQPTKSTTFLASARLDKHNLADPAFSPRLVVIQQINNNNFLKLIVQQSVRLPVFSELFAANYSSGSQTTPEKLKGVELIFTRVQSDDFTINASIYYQTIDQLAWVDEQEESGLIGSFETLGFESNIAYRIDNFNVTVAYSFVNQLNWRPSVEFISWLSNIGLDSLDYPLVDAGANRINNLPKHQLKFVASYAIKEAWLIHLDGRFSTAYGQLDMLDMFKSVHDQYGTIETKNEMNDIYNDVMSYGYAKPSFTSNLSVRYQFPVRKLKFSLSASIMNIVSVNHIRYVYQYWEIGDNRQYPRQVGFVEEPMSLMFKLNLAI